MATNRETEIWSMFGQIECCVAESMAAEGKVRRIEADMIPPTALFNESGEKARFAIVISREYTSEYYRRVADLRA